MAEANFEAFGDVAPASGAGRTQRLINLAGGATSVVLILGLAVWGYRLAVRDVNGIPVIHAMEGPMRITPEDPGGQIADNLGLTVNRVASDAVGLAPTDTLVLAPRPVSLSAQDIAPNARVAAAPVPPPVAAAPMKAAPALATLAPPTVPAPTPPVAPAPPESASASAATVEPATSPDTSASVAAQVPAPMHTAPMTSPRPMARPKARAALPAASIAASASAAATAPPDAPAATAETAPSVAPKAPAAAAPKATAKAPPVPESVDPAKIVAGTRLVQLGAFDSADVAASSWALLQARFGDLMADKSRVVQKATSGGRDFYRLRAYGFKDDAETRRFCAALDAANAPCVPVLVR